MTESDQERRLEEALREQKASLPEDVRDRLAASRRQAVTLMEEADSSRFSVLLAPRNLAMAAAAAVAVLALWIGLLTPDDPALPMISAPEVAVVQDLELLEELEFIAWLEEESQGAG